MKTLSKRRTRNKTAKFNGLTETESKSSLNSTAFGGKFTHSSENVKGNGGSHSLRHGETFHSEKEKKKCKDFVKKLMKIRNLVQKSFSSKTKNNKLSPASSSKKIKMKPYNLYMKELCNTTKCRDMKKMGVNLKNVKNGFNKRYSKKMRDSMRKMGALSLCI